MSKAHKLNPSKPWLGKKRPEAIELMNKVRKEKGIIPNYKHGLSKTKEYQQKKHREYWENHKEHVLFKNHQRRMRKLGNGGNHTLEQWLLLKEKYSYTCLSCGQKEPNIRLTEDRITPLIKKGTDDINNLQPLCLPCNLSKHDKDIDYRGRWEI